MVEWLLTCNILHNNTALLTFFFIWFTNIYVLPLFFLLWNRLFPCHSQHIGDMSRKLPDVQNTQIISKEYLLIKHGCFMLVSSFYILSWEVLETLRSSSYIMWHTTLHMAMLWHIPYGEDISYMRISIYSLSVYIRYKKIENF